MVSDGDSPRDLLMGTDARWHHHAFNGDSPRDLRDLRGTVPVISPVIYFRDFWSSPHHLFPGTVPVIFGPVPAISVISGTVPIIFPYTNDINKNFANQPLVSHVPRNLQ